MRQFKYYASCSRALEVKGFPTKRLANAWVKEMNKKYPEVRGESEAYVWDERTVEEYFSEEE